MEFTLFVQGEKWLVQTSSSDESQQIDQAYTSHEASYDGENLYQISTLSSNLDARSITANNEKSLQNWLAGAKTEAERQMIRQRFQNLDASVASGKPANKATARVSTQKFPAFGMDLVAPAWLAFASGIFFETVTNRTKIPKSVLAIVKPEHAFIADSCELERNGEEPNLPSKLTVYQRTANDGNSPTSSFIRFRYEVSSWTNCNKLTLPTRGKVTAYKAGSHDALYEVEIVTSRVVSPLEALPDFKPEIRVQTHVSDFRFSSELGGRTVSYQIAPPTNWPQMDLIRGSKEYTRVISTAAKSAKPSFMPRRAVILSGLTLTAAAIPLLIYWFNKRTNSASKQT